MNRRTKPRPQQRPRPRPQPRPRPRPHQRQRPRPQPQPQAQATEQPQPQATEQIQQQPQPTEQPQPQPINISQLIINETNKSALLIGCNYIGTSKQLNGCINDVENIKTLLTNKFKFTNIKTLTDNTEQKPTRDNILLEFKNLLINAQDGDVLFFSFSGHGSQTFDINKDEDDRMDETIISLDMKNIIDDEFNSIIKQFMKPNVKLFALFDSCHSGTMLDLNINNNLLGTIVMISGCLDSQTSVDAYINNKFQGAMTWSFLESINSTSTPTPKSWLELVESMKTLLKSRYIQIPLLSMDENILNQPLWF